MGDKRERKIWRDSSQVKKMSGLEDGKGNRRKVFNMNYYRS